MQQLPNSQNQQFFSFSCIQTHHKTRGRERFILNWVPIYFQSPPSYIKEDLLLFFLSFCFEFGLFNSTPQGRKISVWGESDAPRGFPNCSGSSLALPN